MFCVLFQLFKFAFSPNMLCALYHSAERFEELVNNDNFTVQFTFYSDIQSSNHCYTMVYYQTVSNFIQIDNIETRRLVYRNL